MRDGKGTRVQISGKAYTYLKQLAEDTGQTMQGIIYNYLLRFDYAYREWWFANSTCGAPRVTTSGYLDKSTNGDTSKAICGNKSDARSEPSITITSGDSYTTTSVQKFEPIEL